MPNGILIQFLMLHINNFVVIFVPSAYKGFGPEVWMYTILHVFFVCV